MSSNCRPDRCRVLMKLMLEGWREDCMDPALPVGVIGFCAGGISQAEENSEAFSTNGAPWIRESQRHGLADVGDPQNTAFMSACEIQIPRLHPQKKRAHDELAARWALNRVYRMKVNWDMAALVSAETKGDEIVKISITGGLTSGARPLESRPPSRPASPTSHSTTQVQP